jgi:hypothetical protein
VQQDSAVYSLLKREYEAFRQKQEEEEAEEQ